MPRFQPICYSKSLLCVCVGGGGGGGVAMALKRLHICAGSTKPLLLVYTHAERHLHVP